MLNLKTLRLERRARCSDYSKGQSHNQRNYNMRIQFKFWLRDNKSSERELGQWLDGLRSKRGMKPAIVKALRLYKSLLSGDTSVLIELFPNVVQKLKDDSIKDNQLDTIARQSELIERLLDRVA